MIIHYIMHTLNNPHRQITCKRSELCWDCATVLHSTASSVVVGTRLGKVALAVVCRRSAEEEPEAAAWWVLEQMWREKRLTVPESRLELTPHRLDTWSSHAEKVKRHHEGFMLKQRVRGKKDWRWLREKKRKGGGLKFYVCMWSTEWPVRQQTGFSCTAPLELLTDASRQNKL